MGEGVGGMGWKMWTDEEVQIGSCRDVKYSIGNIVNNITITMDGAQWILEISEGTRCKVPVYDSLITMLYAWNQYKIILRVNSIENF